MNIKMIGIDHTRAPLDVRQIFAFTKKGTAEALEWLKKRPGVQGCILLSTCNRMELWFSLDEDFGGSALQLLCRLKRVDKEAYISYFKCRENHEAVEHLFLLAGGMKSQILGEDQILTQVREAAGLAREHYCTDQVLEVLFRMAVTAGKRVKTQVPMQKANFSAAHQAVASLQKQGILLEKKNCLVIGNGELGRLTAQVLKEAGACVTVTVRQYRSGVVEIPKDCERINYADRYQMIPQCDIVFSATASPNFTITKQRLMDRKPAKPQIYVDLAVPRDMEPSIAELKWVQLYDIDSFQIDAMSGEMKHQLALAESIVSEQKEEFFVWYECRDLIPKVQKISGQAAGDVVWRAGSTVKGLELTQEEQEQLETTIKTAAQKVIGKLMFQLRDSLRPEAFRECLDALEVVYQENT